MGDEDLGANRRDELRANAQSRIERLTLREVDVLKLLAGGGSNKSIARVLGISPRTVEIHRSNMMRKLGASSVAHVVKTAIEADLSDDE